MGLTVISLTLENLSFPRLPILSSYFEVYVTCICRSCLSRWFILNPYSITYCMPGTMLEYLVDNKGIKDTAFFLQFSHNCLYSNYIRTVSKGQRARRAWVAQSVECPTLDFSSGGDLKVLGSRPMPSSALSRESAYLPLSLPFPLLTHSLSK